MDLNDEESLPEWKRKQTLSPIIEGEVKEWYEHVYRSSIFVMMDKDMKLHWCPSGNELRRIYLLDPSQWLSAPTELPISPELDKKIMDWMDDF